ncbi:MAG TPA: 50S ribosomal protein L25, partial [Acidimicrobiales bacterium]
MPEIPVIAEVGRPTGSASSRRLRHHGKVPAVLYGHGMEPQPLAVDGRSLRAALTTQAGLNALLSLQVDGASHLAMARDIQRDPVRRTVSHVDFQVVRRDEVMAADVPIVLVGEATEVAIGDGLVDQQMHTLSIRATPDAIPNVIEVDVSGLAIGETIRVGDLELPARVTTEADPEQAVVVGQPPQVLAADLVAEAEAVEGEAAAGQPVAASGPAGDGEAG